MVFDDKVIVFVDRFHLDDHNLDSRSSFDIFLHLLLNLVALIS